MTQRMTKPMLIEALTAAGVNFSTDSTVLQLRRILDNLPAAEQGENAAHNTNDNDVLPAENDAHDDESNSDEFEHNSENHDAEARNEIPEPENDVLLRELELLRKSFWS